MTNKVLNHWTGLINMYRDRMPFAKDWEPVTLNEGGTPLLRANHLSELTGCEVYLKIEGANPTGSFKDRGMTVAVTDAYHKGQKVLMRLDRQHFRLRSRIRCPRWPQVRRADPRGQDCPGQAGTGRDARRADHPDPRKLR